MHVAQIKAIIGTYPGPVKSSLFLRNWISSCRDAGITALGVVGGLICNF